MVVVVVGCFEEKDISLREAKKKKKGTIFFSKFGWFSLQN